MECIVHFQVIYPPPQERKTLRGLIFVGQGQEPATNQLVTMFKDMGFHVRLEDEAQLLFKPTDASANFEFIRVTELDTGEEVYKEDKDLKAILEHLLPRRF
ncbi:hypothetical protein [Paenibacillus silvae]|uniref:Uncharacterized protein n=1 Tax=Paenibacillus silvae TaxID=1325358 RepID=A0A2W6P698_9BACL|nr:hypothetical protein [Paenibacillus silvae]PZT53646.1 hypothetical protein DN757_21325 [Paenibacillus silvae]